MDFPFSLGSTGLAVADLQRKLACLDVYDIPEIAAVQQSSLSMPYIYDQATADAVRAFKLRYGLQPDDETCTEEAWMELTFQTGIVFNEVWQYELDALRGGVAPDTVMPVRDNLVQQAHVCNLAGLAFSGGGMRSATFNLGILQALAELRLLRNFDYLSTVSGGGYIGAWFSRWLMREQGNIGAVERALIPGARGMQHEAHEVKFLRQYANHLATRGGFFSAEKWALVATYVGNTTLNMAILLTLLAALMVVPRLCALLSSGIEDRTIRYFPGLHLPVVAIVLTTAIACVLWSVAMVAFHLTARPNRRIGLLLGQGQASVIVFIVVPLMVAGLCGSIALWFARSDISRVVVEPDVDDWLFIFGTGLTFFTAWCAGWALAQWGNARVIRLHSQLPSPIMGRWQAYTVTMLANGNVVLLCGVAALSLGIFATGWLIRVLSGIDHELTDGGKRSMTVAVVVFGMPAMLMLCEATRVVYMGLLGERCSDKSRAWWSRQSGTVAMGAVTWMALAGVSLYAPGVLAWVQGHAGAWTPAALAGSWLGATVAGLFVGKSDTDAMPKGWSRLELLAKIAPLVFSVGLMCALSALLHHVLADAPAAIDINDKTSLVSVLLAFDAQTLAKSPLALCTVLGGLMGAGLLLAWRVDINKSSLHMIHRNQLVRAFLGASNHTSTRDLSTGLDADDDIQMAALSRRTETGRTMQRPYHIINTTLNLVTEEQVAWQSRKAAGFVFAPAFCGFELPARAVPGAACHVHQAMRGCFRPVNFYTAPGKGMNGEDQGVMLGMAMATSGAAASPGMGFHKSPPLAFLMTLFNMRLGSWFANPRNLVKRPRHNQRAENATVPLALHNSVQPPPMSPLLGIRHLLKELFGMADARSPFLYLSDGGQFENLGVFELVRRRCRLIVAVDAGPDAQFNFSDLGNAIRKCATDLNVDIEIDVGKIEPGPNSNFSSAHCAVGRVRYDKVDEGGCGVGTLLYIKPSLLGTEYAHILSYRKINKGFPHQSTADKWFDEDQFEIYRSLGYSIGMIALAKAVEAASSSVRSPEQDVPGDLLDIPALCLALQAAWPKREVTPDP